jgi:ATP-dependent RNA helicase DDX10/DBP4
MAGATLDGAEDDGYVSPEFDLPSEDEAPAKRPKRHADADLDAGDGLADEEELALALLRRRR